MQLEPDAERVRALLHDLRLDLRISGYDCQNYFQEHVQRLEDPQSVASESVHADWFIDHIDDPDYDYAVDSLKGTSCVSFENCYLI